MGIPSSIITELLGTIGLSPETNTLDDFIAHTKEIEQRTKNKSYYMTLREKEKPQQGRAAPKGKGVGPSKERWPKNRSPLRSIIAKLDRHMGETINEGTNPSSIPKSMTETYISTTMQTRSLHSIATQNNRLKTMTMTKMSKT